MSNMIQLMGHLGTDAETRFTSSGRKVTNVRIATNSRRGDSDVTIWWKVALWGDRFDNILPYLKKGGSLIVVGELQQPEVYQDREGNNRVSLDVNAEFVRFSPFGRSDRAGQGQGQGNNSNAQAGGWTSAGNAPAQAPTPVGNDPFAAPAPTHAAAPAAPAHAPTSFGAPPAPAPGEEPVPF